MIKGIVRNIDDLGRVVIPKEIRKSLNIKEYDPVDIYLKNGVICMEPCRLQCVLCGCKEDDKLVKRNGVHVCTDCIDELAVRIERAEER
jgi:transcriptional pleiotropic regulator of transition state genes